VLALEKHLDFAKERGIELGQSFPSLLACLVSSRPGVFSDALGCFPEMRSLAIQALHRYFLDCVNQAVSASDLRDDVEIVLCGSKWQNKMVKLPLQLLQSLSVLLNIWDDDGELSKSTSSRSAVWDIVDSILVCDENRHEVDEARGLAGARLVESDSVAITCESVSYRSVCNVFLSLHLTGGA
jgi:hypothetical protein